MWYWPDGMERNGIVAGINAQKETLKLKVKLPMIQGGTEVKLYNDDEQLKGKVTLVKMNKKQELDVIIPSNGGFASLVLPSG